MAQVSTDLYHRIFRLIFQQEETNPSHILLAGKDLFSHRPKSQGQAASEKYLVLLSTCDGPTIIRSLRGRFYPNKNSSAVRFPQLGVTLYLPVNRGFQVPEARMRLFQCGTEGPCLPALDANKRLSSLTAVVCDTGTLAIKVRLEGRDTTWNFTDVPNPLEQYHNELSDLLRRSLPSTLEPRPLDRPPLLTSSFPPDAKISPLRPDPSLFELSPGLLRNALTHDPDAAPVFGKGPTALDAVASLSPEGVQALQGVPQGEAGGDWSQGIWTVISPHGEAGDLWILRKKGALKARVLLANGSAAVMALPEKALASFGKDQDFCLRASLHQGEEGPWLYIASQIVVTGLVKDGICIPMQYNSIFIPH